jgi:hypothetical protein
MSNYKPQGTAWTAKEPFYQKQLRDPNMPWLISYPRTGSHWLRMMLELYTGRPLLRRTFFHPEGGEPLLIHEHDRCGEDKYCPTNVLFLYRNPVDTVFSLANYWMCFKLPEEDHNIVRYTNDYMIHLRKWLVTEGFTKKKTIVRYEELFLPGRGVAKALGHFGIEADDDRISRIAVRITKDEVRDHTRDMEKSQFANRVIAPEDDYEQRRAKFHAEKTDLVWDTIKKDSAIAAWFEEIG